MLHQKIVIHAMRSALTFVSALILYDVIKDVAVKYKVMTEANHVKYLRIFNLCGVFLADLGVICFLNYIFAMSVV